MQVQRARGFLALFKRDLLNLLLSPVLVSQNTVFPFLLVLILGYMGRGIYSGGEVTSYDYYGITIMIFMVLNVSMTASNSFMERSIKTSNLRILYSPMPTSFVYLSKIVATFIFTSMSLLLIAGLLHSILGVHVGGRDAVYVMLLLLGFNLFSSALGVACCCLFKSEEISNKLLSIVNNILALIGGLFLQLDGLGKTVEAISYLSPVKWVAEGIFRMIYDQDFGLFFPTLAICAAGSLLLVGGCKLFFRAEDYV
ncbi:ABC transporter permease [Paenibacillus sp. J2TS4]|uniref:ABC transporter permease n=1 Tax=Paenibacillus sp. J2TS4 TaxID=2807194 RepID=UPI001B06D4AA|nr:ABC transporter permease [Paenibacillus sp. J2TS4]GIP33192.1 transport permease protein [Paenibacillus sp. J2TS4]